MRWKRRVAVQKKPVAAKARRLKRKSPLLIAAIIPKKITGNALRFAIAVAAGMWPPHFFRTPYIRRRSRKCGKNRITTPVTTLNFLNTFGDRRTQVDEFTGRLLQSDRVK